MIEYLTRDHADALVDFPPLIENERGAAAHAIPAGSVQCPKCKGHGGWNLRLNAYPLRNMADTRENRHLYSHFRASCDQCVGWGYVTAEDAQCLHEWGAGQKVGHCLHVYTCKKCGAKREVDSSD